MDTLLELYDVQEPVINIAGAWHLQPSSIIFFYYDLADPAAERRQLSQLLNRVGLRCNVRMERLERFDMDGMIAWVKAHQDELGQYAMQSLNVKLALMGLTLCTFDIENISLPEEVEKAMKE